MKNLLIAALVIAGLSGCAAMDKRNAYANEQEYSERESVALDLSSVQYLHSLGEGSAMTQKAPVGASALAAMSSRYHNISDVSRSNAQSDDDSFEDDQGI